MPEGRHSAGAQAHRGPPIQCKGALNPVPPAPLFTGRGCLGTVHGPARRPHLVTRGAAAVFGSRPTSTPAGSTCRTRLCPPGPATAGGAGVPPWTPG